MTTIVDCLFKELSHLSQVEAIALGGSRATGRNDEKSDYDVYVYIKDSIPENDRRCILEKYCRYMEIGNTFWELEDDVTLNNGIDMDIIYRNMADFENTIEAVVIKCVPWNGAITRDICKECGPTVVRKTLTGYMHSVSRFHYSSVQFSSIQSLSRVRLFETP